MGHTKGNWRQFAPSIRNKSGEFVTDEGYRSIECSSESEYHWSITGYIPEADAKLMVAAPELLEALKDIIESGYLSEYAWQDGIHAKAIEAIKKAES